MVPLHLKIRLGIWNIFGLLTLIFISPLIPDEQVLLVEFLGVLLVLLGDFVMLWSWFRSPDNPRNQGSGWEYTQGEQDGS